MFNWSSFYWWKSFHLTNRLHVLYTTNIIVPLKVNRSSTGCIRRVAFFFSFIDDNRIFSFNSHIYESLSLLMSLSVWVHLSKRAKSLSDDRSRAWVLSACMHVDRVCMYVYMYMCVCTNFSSFCFDSFVEKVGLIMACE